jgi:hypothetical protein
LLQFPQLQSHRNRLPTLRSAIRVPPRAEPYPRRRHRRRPQNQGRLSPNPTVFENSQRVAGKHHELFVTARQLRMSNNTKKPTSRSNVPEYGHRKNCIHEEVRGLSFLLHQLSPAALRMLVAMERMPVPHSQGLSHQKIFITYTKRNPRSRDLPVDSVPFAGHRNERSKSGCSAARLRPVASAQSVPFSR